MRHVIVFGASGAIGQAFVSHYAGMSDVECVHACSRSPIHFQHSSVVSHPSALTDEPSILALSETFSAHTFDRLIIATGLLHDSMLMPEKSISDIEEASFMKIFWVNVLLPSLILKHFLPKMKSTSVCAVLSARVGSISDNRLGGWYAYRASKAALNMMVKSLSIDWQRMHPHVSIVGLHPGTVNSALSKPFQSRLKSGQLFTPEVSVAHMYKVLESITIRQTGRCFAYDGTEILP